MKQNKTKTVYSLQPIGNLKKKVLELICVCVGQLKKKIEKGKGSICFSQALAIFIFNLLISFFFFLF